MSFTSYAQNFEDVMLWRALKHVERGFYIDVGANDPVVDSVTLAFYERGWRGINIEPMTQYHALLAASRPRDVNLQLAIGDQTGTITFYEVPDSGLSTMDEGLARQHAGAGRAVVEKPVPVATLTEVCNEHAEGPIHFLKIDVEGFEAAVLRGMDFRRWRPWILVVEATLPQTQQAAHEEWQPMVLSAGYTLAYFDGLNQFYVAQEHAELLPAFSLPPNFFDGFKLREGHFYSSPPTALQRRLDEEWARATNAENHALRAEATAARATARALRIARRDLKMRHRLHETQAQLAAAQNEAAVARQLAHELNARANALSGQVDAMHASTSWRVTAPLRWAGAQRLALRQQGASERLRRGARKAIVVVGRPVMRVLDRHPRARLAALRVARAVGVADFLKRLRDNQHHMHAAPPPASQMTASAQRAHEALKFALTTHRKDA